MNKQRNGFKTLSVISAIVLSGCASSPATVGRVVVAPKVEEPPPPKIMEEVKPKEPGYYRRKIEDSLTEP